MFLYRLLALICVCFSSSVYAEQLKFAKSNKADGLLFSYEWLYEGDSKSLDFTLSNEALTAMPQRPIRFNLKMMQQEIHTELLRVAQSAQEKGVRVLIRRENDGFNYRVSGPSHLLDPVMDDLKRSSDTAKKNFYSNYRFKKYQLPSGGEGIIYDHAFYAQQSAPGFMPIVEALQALQRQQNDTREFISLAMSWIQSIPYNDLQSRMSSNGVGFAPPTELLSTNRGDCDSKSTLLAAILKAYNPNLEVNMLLLPNHALLAINLPALPSERTIQHENRRLLLIEPTGPAQYKIGEVGDDTELALRNRQFSLTQL